VKDCPPPFLLSRAPRTALKWSYRATMKIGMANIVYNMKRLVFLNRTAGA
jgi:hypothetical protein